MLENIILGVIFALAIGYSFIKSFLQKILVAAINAIVIKNNIALD